jgi:hypothetical protein
MKWVRGLWLLNAGTVSIAVFLHTMRFKKLLPPRTTFSCYLIMAYASFSGIQGFRHPPLLSASRERVPFFRALVGVCGVLCAWAYHGEVRESVFGGCALTLYIPPTPDPLPPQACGCCSRASPRTPSWWPPPRSAWGSTFGAASSGF